MKTFETSSTSSASSFFSTAAKKKKTMKMSLGLKRRTPSSSLLGRLVVRAAATDATDENESSSSSSTYVSQVERALDRFADTLQDATMKLGGTGQEVRVIANGNDRNKVKDIKRMTDMLEAGKGSIDIQLDSGTTHAAEIHR